MLHISEFSEFSDALGNECRGNGDRDNDAAEEQADSQRSMKVGASDAGSAAQLIGSLHGADEYTHKKTEDNCALDRDPSLGHRFAKAFEKTNRCE
jgi:hypothetical protein